MAWAAAWKDFHSSSLVAPPVVLSFGFDPTSVCAPPPQASVPCLGESEGKQQLHGACLLSQARRSTVATIGVCVSCLWWWNQQALVTDCGALALVGMPPSACGGRSCHGGSGGSPASTMYLSTMGPHF